MSKIGASGASTVVDRPFVPRISGKTMLATAGIIMCIALGVGLYQYDANGNDIAWQAWMSIPISLLAVLILKGMADVKSGETEIVVTLFGIYRGTIKRSGWYWTNPFARLIRIPLMRQELVVPGFIVTDDTGASLSVAVRLTWKYQGCADAFFNDSVHQKGLREILDFVVAKAFAATIPRNTPVQQVLASLIDDGAATVWGAHEALQEGLKARSIPVDIIDLEIDKVQLRTNTQTFLRLNVEICD